MIEEGAAAGEFAADVDAELAAAALLGAIFYGRRPVRPRLIPRTRQHRPATGPVAEEQTAVSSKPIT